MPINLTWNCRVCVQMVFLCLLCAFLPNTTLEWIDQKFAKTKMEYISLPSNLNSIIGTTSYYCVILKIMIFHDPIKTIKNKVFPFSKKKITKLCFFFKKTEKPVFLKKQKQVGFFFFWKNPGFSQPWLKATSTDIAIGKYPIDRTPFLLKTKNVSFFEDTKTVVPKLFRAVT